jgi:phage gp46-like protein
MMDFKIIFDSDHPEGMMTFEKNSDIKTSIFLSLNIKKGDFFQNLDFGSELYKINKITDQNVNLAKQYIQHALTWLISSGRATSLNVIVEKDSIDKNRINVKIEMTEPSGNLVQYSMFRTVGLSESFDYYLDNGVVKSI